MPDYIDRQSDTRWLARETAAAQREQRRVTKAVGAVQQNAMLPVAKQANVRRIACYTLTGSYVGLLRPQKLLARNAVAKAGTSQLIAVYTDEGALLGTCDPKAVEGLAAGESFSYDEDGRIVGVVGSDHVVRPVTPSQSSGIDNGEAERDAAAWRAAVAPASAPGTVTPTVAKAKRPPMTWAQATAGLRQLRLALARERVRKAASMDTRNLGPRDEVIRLLEELEPVLKRSAPPKPDAERYLRALGVAANAMLVRKSGNPGTTADPMLAAALVYQAMPPAQQAQVRKALARTDVASRQRARRALTAATNEALDPVGELRVVANGRRQG